VHQLFNSGHISPRTWDASSHGLRQGSQRLRLAFGEQLSSAATARGLGWVCGKRSSILGESISVSGRSTRRVFASTMGSSERQWIALSDSNFAALARRRMSFSNAPAADWTGRHHVAGYSFERVREALGERKIALVQARRLICDIGRTCALQTGAGVGIEFSISSDARYSVVRVEARYRRKPSSDPIAAFSDSFCALEIGPRSVVTADGVEQYCRKKNQLVWRLDLTYHVRATFSLFGLVGVMPSCDDRPI